MSHLSRTPATPHSPHLPPSPRKRRPTPIFTPHTINISSLSNPHQHVITPPSPSSLTPLSTYAQLATQNTPFFAPDASPPKNTNSNSPLLSSTDDHLISPNSHTLWNSESKALVLDSLINCRILSAKHARAEAQSIFFSVTLQLIIIICACLGSGSIISLLCVRSNPWQTVCEVFVAVFYHVFVIAQSFSNYLQLDKLAQRHHQAASHYYHLSNRLEIELTYRVHATSVENSIHAFTKIQERAPVLPLWMRFSWRHARKERDELKEEFARRWERRYSESGSDSSRDTVRRHGRKRKRREVELVDAEEDLFGDVELKDLGGSTTV